MGKPTGFMDIEKVDRGYKPVSERISNYKEFYNTFESLIDNESLLLKMSKKCTRYFNKKKGAIGIILNNLKLRN